MGSSTSEQGFETLASGDRQVLGQKMTEVCALLVACGRIKPTASLSLAES
jgi:hypothetical protein